MLKNLTIGKKIGLGFGVLMALLVVVVALSYNGVGGIVANASEVITGNKLDDKIYYRHSQYPGGLRAIPLREQLEKHPERVIQLAVRGMLPKNKLGRKMIKKLKIYTGDTHPHEAQQPRMLEL